MFKSLFGKSTSQSQPNTPPSDAFNNVQLQRQVILMALPTLERAAKKIPASDTIVISDCSRTISNDAARVMIRGVRSVHPNTPVKLYRTYEEEMEPTNNTSVAILPPVLDKVCLNVSMATLQYLSARPVTLNSTLLSSSSKVTEEQAQLYREQAERDLVGYLRARSVEMRSGGQLVLTLLLSDVEAQAQGCALLRDFSTAAERLLAQNKVSMEEFQRMSLPIHLRSDDEVNHALASVKDVFITQEYSDRWITVPAWSMFEEGTIGREAYAKACFGFVASLARDWMTQALSTVVSSMRLMEITHSMQAEFQQVVQQRPEQGKFRFAVMRLERL